MVLRGSWWGLTDSWELAKILTVSWEITNILTDSWEWDLSKLTDSWEMAKILTENPALPSGPFFITFRVKSWIIHDVFVKPTVLDELNFLKSP